MRGVFDSRSTTGTDTGFGIFQYGRTIEVYGSGLKVSSAASALTINSWNHIALTRSSGTCQLFINGSSSGSSGSYSADLTSTVVRVGDTVNTSFPYIGYISNLRVVIGSVLYSGATYTVPTAPFTAISGTSLLLNFTNAGIYDATSKNDLETLGAASISTAISAKWGSGCMAFNGSTDYMLSPAPPGSAYDLRGDFTIEAWVYKTNSSEGTIAGIYRFGDVNVFQYIFYVTSSGVLNIDVYQSGAVFTSLSSSVSISLNNWQYVAATRSGNTLKLFINGTERGSTTTTVVPMTLTASTQFSIGAYKTLTPAIVGYWQGYIQDLRITKYARTITASPTAAFPTL